MTTWDVESLFDESEWNRILGDGLCGSNSYTHGLLKDPSSMRPTLRPWPIKRSSTVGVFREPYSLYNLLRSIQYLITTDSELVCTIQSFFMCSFSYLTEYVREFVVFLYYCYYWYSRYFNLLTIFQRSYMSYFFYRMNLVDWWLSPVPYF